MYYTDVSSNIEASLKKVENLEINKFLDVDWMGVVSITKDKQVFINEERSYKKINTHRIIKHLEGKVEDILLSEGSKIYNITIEEKDANILITPIRVHSDFKTYGVFFSEKEKYSSKDSAIAEFIINVIYENILLNNEIIQEKNYLQNIIDSTDGSIISMNLDRIVTTANRGTEEVYGCTPEELIGQNYQMVLTKEEIDRTEKVIKYVIKNNKTRYEKEAVYTNKNKINKFLHLAVCPLNDSNNKVVGIVILAKDITKLKIYETELQQLRQFAILGEVATGVAHDIRNPLMSIKGCVNILIKYLKEQEEYMKFLQVIGYEADRINDVVTQMLSYSIVTKENNYTLLSINEILEKCIDIIRFYKESKYITIEKDFVEEIPLIEGNNVQLQQAFINILINAVQAIDKEGIIEIKSCYLKNEGKILIIIKDNGVGIMPEKINEIFTPFYSTKKNGIGFGLSIVKRAVEKHHGEIKVISELNLGTKFEIYLPVRKD